MYVIYLIVLLRSNFSFWLTFKERIYLEERLEDSIFLLGYRSLFSLRIFSDISQSPEPKSPKSLTLYIHEGEMPVIGHPGILWPPRPHLFCT